MQNSTLMGGVTDTLSNVDRFLIRNDSITPTPIGNHPRHVTTMIGLDNIMAGKRNF